MIQDLKNKMSHAQAIALGFFLVILTGTLLLMLPFSSRSGETTGFLTALFTATSATCVTGLVVVDTFRHWTVFGQLVILLMIQVGGLGFMTIGVMFTMFLNKKISLRTRGLLQDSFNVLQVGGIVRLTKRIAYGTVIIEMLGTALLSIRFLPEFGVWKGFYYALFHSVSAFCNAGFDLMGGKEAYSSFLYYSDDILVNVTIMSLIVIGGIGFIVWDDIMRHRFDIKSYRLHTKIVLSTTAILIIGGSILFYIFEKGNLMADMSFKEKVLTSMFSSVTARTAGFNTIDTASLASSSKQLTILLMFIGGSPGSTAGGVKTVTAAVLFLGIWSGMQNTRSCNVFGRRIEDAAFRKASTVVATNLFMAVLASIAICALQPLSSESVIFEVVSAIGTVGMSAGITRELGCISRIIIILLMFCGRIGSLSFAMSFTEKRKVVPVQQPVEQVMLG